MSALGMARNAVLQSFQFIIAESAFLTDYVCKNFDSKLTQDLSACWHKASPAAFPEGSAGVEGLGIEGDDGWIATGKRWQMISRFLLYVTDSWLLWNKFIR